NDWGLLLAVETRLKEAETMYQRALLCYGKAWGPEHSGTLDTCHNSGSLYVGLGRLSETKKMCQRALQGYEKTLGPEHTSTL
ncbi:uncharacterized protein CC84DRAFT_1046574, partial [Paraphaeosphaeria sporulosa]